MRLPKAYPICFVILLTSISLITLPMANSRASAANGYLTPPAADDPGSPLSVPAIEFSTYLKGRSANGVALDAEGNIYVTGNALSDFAATPGAAQSQFGGGDSDAFVMKLNAAGTQIIYATYLGGSGYDSGESITVDAAGNAYVTGTTSSTDFPTTPGAYQTSGRGSSTIFVAKLNSTGRAQAYSTYIGNGEDGGRASTPRGIAIDAAGNAYVTGGTNTLNFPITPGAFRSMPGDRPFISLAFVTKLNASGTALVYSTYLGPGNGLGITVDAAGHAYVGGNTGGDFPTTPGAYQPVFRGERNDGFVMKLNPQGSGLIYSTYLGGTKDESIGSIAIDAGGNAYVTGGTFSSDFPTTPGAFSTSARSTFSKAFVTKLNVAGSGLVYSTYVSGRGLDSGRSIALDAAGNAYVAGSTASADFPTVNAVQRTNGGGPTFKSENQGANWSLMASGLKSAAVQTLVIDPINTTTLYAGTSDGVFKSTNGGLEWSASSSGLTMPAIQALAIDPHNPATLYASTSNNFEHGVFKSVDGGANWAVVSLDMVVSPLTVDPTNSQKIFAGGNTSSNDSGSVARSTNGGASWNVARISGTNSVTALAVDPANPSTVYAGARLGGSPPSPYNAMFKSTDGGSSWTRLNGFFDDPIRAIAIAQTSPPTIYVGEGILSRSTDGGLNWTELSNGLKGFGVEGIVIDPTDSSTIYLALGGSYENGIFKSTDSGDHWTATGLRNVSAGAVALDPAHPAKLYAATGIGADAFVAKLNATGSAFFYSTYLGGMADESVSGMITIDAAGNTVVTGNTRSPNFPLANALNTSLGSGFTTAFVTKLGPSPERAVPIINSVAISGKHLIVVGENFSDGARVVLNDETQKTIADEASPNNSLLGKKVGKRIARGETVTIQVKNSDGGLSEPFRFTRN
jgi:hypothetical protein